MHPDRCAGALALPVGLEYGQLLCGFAANGKVDAGLFWNPITVPG